MAKHVAPRVEVSPDGPHALLHAALDAMSAAVLITGPHQPGTGPTIGFANRAMQALTGFEAAELVGHPAALLFDPGTTRTELRRLYRALLRDGRHQVTGRLRRKDGTMLLVDQVITAVPDQHGGSVGGWMATLQPRADAKATGGGRTHDQVMLEGISHLVWQSLDDGRWYAASPQWTDFTGQTEAMTLDRGWVSSIHPDDRSPTLQAWHEAVACGVFKVDHRIRRHDGAYRWFQTRALPIEWDGVANDPRHWVGTSTDVDDLHQAQERISYLAYHDLLTDLGNRMMLVEALDRMLSAGREVSPSNLLSLDVDDFKLVNDRFGPRVADRLLCEIARRLTAAVRPGDVVVRMGGDEFALLQRAATPADGMELADRLCDALAEAFHIDQQVVRIDVSIGIACHPGDGDRTELLLKHADLARSSVKSTGGGRPCFFEPAMEAARRERLMLQTGLAEALDHDELALHYQPVFGAVSGVLCGYEALVRWPHPERGAIPPSTFIPIAEETGLIVRLGEWVLRRACLDAADSAFGGLSVAVNLSPMQFRTGDLARTIIDTLAMTGLSPDRLVLEITERLLMDSSEMVDQTLRALRAAAVRIALDDFGTGYSNLGYLCRFPFDQLKIDQSFVALIEQDEGAQAVVSGIVALAHDLGISVTAEGVETEPQRLKLQSIGCDHLQGYLLGRPLPMPYHEAAADGGGG